METQEEIQKSLIALVEYLDKVAIENTPCKLNEAVKKFIAARILVKSLHSASDLAIEQELDSNIRENSKKLISTIVDENTSDALSDLITSSNKDSSTHIEFDKILDILKDVEDEGEIPDDILFNPFNDDSSNPTQAVQAPKSRGRPKKHIVLASTEQFFKESFKIRARKTNLVFIALLRLVLTNLARYFHGTTGRILLITKTTANKNAISTTEKEKSSKKDQLEPQIKRIKLEGYSNNNTSSSSPLNSAESKLMDIKLIQCLIFAAKCWKFLEESDLHLKKILDKFMTDSNVPKFEWYRRFSIDRLIVMSAVSDVTTRAKETLQEDCQSEPNPQSNILVIRQLTQLVSCQYFLGNTVDTCEGINEVLTKMKSCGMLASDESYLKGDSIDEYIMHISIDAGPQLDLLFFDALSILKYCISILMDILKQYISKQGNVSEIALGHTITLSQFDWPKKANTYKRCIKWIRANKPTSTTPQCLSDSTKFTYPGFFQFIKNPHIIEDFMALLCQGYTLDIRGSGSTSQSSVSIPGSRASERTSTRSGKAITTRGTNKSFKEDLKVALVSQMRNSSFLVPLEMNAEFIQSSLLPYLVQASK